MNSSRLETRAAKESLESVIHQLRGDVASGQHKLRTVELHYNQIIVPMKHSLNHFMSLSSKERAENVAHSEQLARFSAMENSLSEVQGKFVTWAAAKRIQQDKMRNDIHVRDLELAKTGGERETSLKAQVEALQAEREKLLGQLRLGAGSPRKSPTKQPKAMGKKPRMKRDRASTTAGMSLSQSSSSMR